VPDHESPRQRRKQKKVLRKNAVGADSVATMVSRYRSTDTTSAKTTTTTTAAKQIRSQAPPSYAKNDFVGIHGAGNVVWVAHILTLEPEGKAELQYWEVVTGTFQP